MVFGKVIEGMKLVRQMEDVETSSIDAPLSDIVITDARVVEIEPFDTPLESVDDAEDYEEDDEEEDDEGDDEGEQ